MFTKKVKLVTQTFQTVCQTKQSKLIRGLANVGSAMLQTAH